MKAKGEEGESLKKKESGGRVLDLRKFCVGRERKRKKREKKIEKRNRGKSEEDGGFERFYWL